MQKQRNKVFGKRDANHMLIIAKGDQIRHMVIRPWMFGLIGCFIGVMAIGYLLATTYLVLRDDLIGASLARQARVQHVYEDRIAQLRTELDRVTSRQLLDQQLIQDQVAELMVRQSKLVDRHGQMSPILDRAGLLKQKPKSIPIPVIRSQEQRAELTPDQMPSLASAFSSDFDLSNDNDSQVDRALHTGSIANVTQSHNLFGEVALALKDIENEQFQNIQALAQSTAQRAEDIQNILKLASLPQPDLEPVETAIGGPFIASDLNDFDYNLRGLDQALNQLDKLRDYIGKLPVKNPVAGARVSSHFGTRRDPFLKRKAFHAGIDFRAPTGTRVVAAAHGKVVKAGWAGGYGRMVEIDHGKGIKTRYAHLSKIHVSVGKWVSPQTLIGRVGSTGRSTGPHLHYEIRRNGKPINPSIYLSAGQKLRPLMTDI